MADGVWLGVVDLVWLSLRCGWVCLKGCGRLGVTVPGVWLGVAERLWLGVAVAGCGWVCLLESG